MTRDWFVIALPIPGLVSVVGLVVFGLSGDGVPYPAEDVDLDAVDRFDATRIHYNKY